MHLTPEIMRAAYAFACQTPPFDRWAMPDAEEVEFHVTRSKRTTADCNTSHGDKHRIRMSSVLVGRVYILLQAMMHEMCHVYCDRQGVRAHHGKDFQRCAALVCKQHGFDPKIF